MRAWWPSPCCRIGRPVRELATLVEDPGFVTAHAQSRARLGQAYHDRQSQHFVLSLPGIVISY